MKAERIVIPRVGGPDVLSLERFEAQPPGAGELTIEVAAAGVNFADLFCRLGLYQAAPSPPFTPGFEVAGVVTRVGEGVSHPAVGDRVLALTRFGGYTSRPNVQASWTRLLPEGWSFEQGAAFPAVFLTAHHGLVRVGRLARGETLVVHSAAGGVGTAACQIGRALGARVLGTVGSDEKRRVAHEAGAEQVVASRRYRVWDAIDRWTEGRGVDVILDAVGGRGLRHGYERLRPGGRLLVYGFAEMMPRGGLRNWPLLAWRYARTPRFSPLDMTGTNRTIAGFNLVWLWREAERLGAAFDELMRMAAAGEIRPVVGSSFPFERAAEAHALMHSRRSTGKIVLVRRPEPHD